MMTIHLLFGDEIRSEVLKILSGECLLKRNRSFPRLYILSPWISDVDIEFSDLHVLKEARKLKQREGGDFLFLDYNIKSINLPYALLLLKLHGGCEAEFPCNIDIVTLPPNEAHYSSDYLPKAKALLDFLDEIGCNIFVNSKLHSKLLLANDLALLGSFNLSSSALYYREEIGVSINDLDNLDKLERYCWNVIHGSQPYGYTSLLHYGNRLEEKPYEPPDYVEGMSEEEHVELLRQWSKSEDAVKLAEIRFSRTNRITKGYFLDYMVQHAFDFGYGEFLDITGGYDRAIKSYSRDLNLFYLMNLRRLISTPKGKEVAIDFFRYKGDESLNSIMEFVNNKFARKTVPDIRLRIKSLE